jgi:type I restriction enzyme M protein
MALLKFTQATDDQMKKASRKGKAGSANGRTAALPEPAQPTKKAKPAKELDKSLESWIWDAACSIRGAKDAPKYKEFILPLIFTKRLCDVFDDELNRIAKEVGSRAKAFKLVKHDKKLVRFFLPLEPKNSEDLVWSVIRTLSTKIGEQLTTYMRAIADANPLLKGIIDRVDFNATTHGQRDIDDDRLSNLIEAISAKRLGLSDVEPDIIGRSYEYLIRKFAEGSGQSAGEFYTPAEVGFVMARIMDPEPGMEIYDPCCGSAGLLIKCDLVLQEKMNLRSRKTFAPAKLYGQENEPGTWAMANMNMIIHDMEGEIQIGDTFRNPKFRSGNRLRIFDRVVANPMWNQTEFKEKDYDADELDRFPKGAGFPGGKADWGWIQHILASLKPSGRAAVVLDPPAASRGSGNANSNKERDVRGWFVKQDLIESVIYLPENLFYNTPSPGIIIVLNRAKPTERRGRVLLINASLDFIKGEPKNYLSIEAVRRISDTFRMWAEVDKYSRIITREEIAKTDFNISPSRYIHTGAVDQYRPIEEIMDELEGLDACAYKIDVTLRAIVRKLSD